MNRSRLTWLTIICFLSLAACYLLVPVGFLAIRARHRHEMWEQIERSSEVTIRVPAQLLRWEIEGKEIRWQGRLFDVKDIFRDGSFLTLTGLFDEDEQRLENEFSILWDRRQEQGNSKGFSMGRFFQLLMYPDIYAIQLNSFVVFDQSEFIIRNADPPSFGPHQPVTPPPEHTIAFTDFM